MLCSSEFLFRKEVAVGSGGGKSDTLDAYSRAARLSPMWNTTPDAELLKAAGKPTSSTRPQALPDRWTG